MATRANNIKIYNKVLNESSPIQKFVLNEAQNIQKKLLDFKI